MTFKSRLQIKMIFSLASLAIGIFLILYAVISLSGSIMSTVLGVGIGTSGAGIIATIYSVLYYTNNEKYKKAEFKIDDERNQLILDRASQITFAVTLITLFVVNIIFRVLGNPLVSHTLISVIWFMILVFLVSKLILNKLY